MASERKLAFPSTTVSELCSRVTSGGTPARARASRYYASTGHPWVKSKELIDGKIRETEEHLTEAALEESAAKLLPVGTVLMAMYGATVSQLGVLAVRAACNQACAAMIVDEDKAIPQYLFYALVANRNVIRSVASGSAQQNINASIVRNLELPNPSLGEQNRIVWVLSSLDDKIELNRRMAWALEETAATIFRALFIDFVGVEDFENSEMGKIPKGWHVSSAGEIFDPVGGGTPSTKNPEFWDGGTHYWATPKDMSGHDSPVLLETSRMVTDAGASKVSSGVLSAGAVLLSSRAPVGYTAITAEPMAVNQGFIAIPASSGFPPAYALFWIRQNMDEIKRRASGTTFAEISKSKFRPIPAVVPSESAMSAFERTVKPMFDQIEIFDRQTRTLTAIRDELLPKLISGKIRVPEGVGPDVDADEVLGELAAESAQDEIKPPESALAQTG